MDPSAALTELGRIDLRQQDFQQVLQRVADLAKASIPGAEEASISLLRDGHGTTPAYTGPLALRCDETQNSQGAGPCLYAAEAGGAVVVKNLATEERWPDYAPVAVAAGALSSLSLGLPLQEAVTGAVNLYSTRAEAFDDDSIDFARGFAAYAAVAVANAHLYASTAALAQQMQEAMATRAVIEQAKGVIMGRRGCDPDGAFDLLVRASSRRNRKLREIAVEVVASAQRRDGQAPEGRG